MLMRRNVWHVIVSIACFLRKDVLRSEMFWQGIVRSSKKTTPRDCKGCVSGRSWIRTNVGLRQRVYSPSHLAALAFALILMPAKNCVQPFWLVAAFRGAG